MEVTMYYRYSQQPLKAMKVKRKKAEDLLAGLLVYRADLGADGEELIRLLLNAGIRVRKTDSSNHQSTVH